MRVSVSPDLPLSGVVTYPTMGHSLGGAQSSSRLCRQWGPIEEGKVG